MTYHSRIILANSLAALIAAGAATTATAATSGPTMRVPFNRSELSTPAGAQGLYDRIRQTARRTCRPNQSSSLAEQMTAASCRRELVKLAVDQLSDPIVTAIHQGRDPAIRFASRK